MGMEISKSFVVKAPRAAVWDFLTDPYQVAKCLPGAAVTEKVDDRTYAGTMTVKVGPVTASYRGKLRFERLDEAAGEAELAASGQETRGKGGADMRMKSRVIETGPAETEVTVISDVNVMGVLAQFGRGMIQDVSDQLFGKFSEAMRRELESPAAAPAPVPAAPPVAEAPPAPAPTVSAAPVAAAPPSPPPPAPPPAAENVLDVGALGAAAAGRAAGRTVRRPVFWIVVIVLALLLYWLFFRQ
ncbi:MAG: carbon monoxide dehydrogenase [Acidobacteria bacterium]|nr:MAG: carbon monoxide dehydrogenase [Acidobacteriota bacterium]